MDSLDYWISNHTFGIYENYKEKPEYIEAQKFWSTRKAELYETYKNDHKVKRFLDNLTVTEFYREKDEAEEDYGAYKVALILKFGHIFSHYYSPTFPIRLKYNFNKECFGL